MTIFLSLLTSEDKAASLLTSIKHVQGGKTDPRVIDANPQSFDVIPGSPFSYWASQGILNLYSKFDRFDSQVETCRGMSTLDDFRFIRCWWEVKSEDAPRSRWVSYSKGEENVPYYDGVQTVAKWINSGQEVKAFVEAKVGSASRTIQAESRYFQPGLTWIRRTHRLCVRPMPAGVIFSGGSQAIFPQQSNLLTFLGIASSSVFDALTKVSVGRTGDAVQFEPGMLAQVPCPKIGLGADDISNRFAHLAAKAWAHKYKRDTASETSLFFKQPSILCGATQGPGVEEIDTELVEIQAEIDALAFEVYGISASDCIGVVGLALPEPVQEDTSKGISDAPENHDLKTGDLLSWAVGVAFGRYDWRFATDERRSPADPGPFDRLPVQSPGMLPPNSIPFRSNAAVLADDRGHEYDLADIVHEVLAHVKIAVSEDIRRWLRREFFPVHLQRYSRSRRKAPIYWPLATASGSYTLWIYYPNLTNQSLYTAVNDFVEPKLREVGDDLTALRNRGSSRAHEDEKQLEALQSFELELIEMRDALLKLALGFKPNHDDGVQISAAPLWPMFRHRPWQKVLKDTWAKLEKGDYDWAHLAMSYWPDRVREKCKTDKSLAIAHGLEHLYVAPEAKPKKNRGRKTAGDAE